MDRRLLSTGAVLVVGLAVSACGTSDSDAGGEGDTPTVTFSALQDPAPIPALVMEEEGIDEKHGFNAELKVMDPDASQTSFLMGESDVAVDMDAVAAAIARNEGHGIVAFYPALTNTAAVVVPKDSSYQGPEDLVGERVGHFGVDSGTTQSIALTMQEFFDVDPLSDYTLSEAGPAALPELLASGEVEAIFDFEPFPLRAVADTPGRYLMKVAKVWQDEWGWNPPIAMLTAKDEWLTENPELARSVVAAWQEATQQIVDSDYEMFREEPYKSFLNLRDEAELDALVTYCQDLPCFSDTWGPEAVEKQMDYLELMVEQGSILTELPDEPPVAMLDDVLE